MKARFFILSILTVLAVSLFAGSSDEFEYVEGNVIIQTSDVLEILETEPELITNKGWFNDLVPEYQISGLIHIGEGVLPEDKLDEILFYKVVFDTIFAVEDLQQEFDMENEVIFSGPNFLLKLYGINTNDFYADDMWGVHIQSYRMNNNDYPFVLIANNTFIGNNYYQAVYAEDLFFIFNEVNNCQGVRSYGHYFANEFNNCDQGIENTTSIPGSLYIKSNHFIGGYDGINIDDAYVEISDNYFEGCDLDTNFNSFGKIFNNKIDEGLVFVGIDMNFYNNRVMNYNGTSCALSGYNVHNLGNILYNNETTFYDNNDTLHTNCIILQNEELFWSPILHGTDTFRNCIIDFELDYPLIDGGGESYYRFSTGTNSFRRYPKWRFSFNRRQLGNRCRVRYSGLLLSVRYGL